MKTIAAGRFKDLCLKMLDDVAATKTPVVITKRGRPVAKLVPYVHPARKRSGGRGSTANGVPASDEDDGAARKRRYEGGADLVSRID